MLNYGNICMANEMSISKFIVNAYNYFYYRHDITYMYMCFQNKIKSRLIGYLI